MHTDASEFNGVTQRVRLICSRIWLFSLFACNVPGELKVLD